MLEGDALHAVKAVNTEERNWSCIGQLIEDTRDIFELVEGLAM